MLGGGGHKILTQADRGEGGGQRNDDVINERPLIMKDIPKFGLLLKRKSLL